MALLKSTLLTVALLLWFCTVSCQQRASFVKLTEDAQDASAGNLSCYLVETTFATYYLEKDGLGLSSMIDPNGNDWISFDPTPGTGSAGEYRGFPNAVHKQDDSFFHPKNQGTTPSSSQVIQNTFDNVSIKGTSGNGNWECVWDFYPTHCTFTMTKMPQNFAYWILYEGTPGGSFEMTDWWMTSAIDTKQPLSIDHQGDIPDPEWLVFGDDKAAHTLFLMHHTDDDESDNFFQMQENMTVFGFGRVDLQKFIKAVPHSFSIGFIETDQHQSIGGKIRELIE